MNPFTTYAEFTKVDTLPDGTVRVYAVVNDETPDDQGEICDYEGTAAALDDFMKWANVREMHQPSAVGVAEVMTHDPIAKRSEAVLHVIDPDAVQKVLTGVYKGTSLGGSKGMPTSRRLEKVAGQTVVRLLAPIVKEISLVDRPSRPTAVLSLMKRSEPTAEELIEDYNLSKTTGGSAPDERTLPTTETEGDGDVTKKAAADAADLEKGAEAEPVADPVVETPETPAALAKAAADDIVSIHLSKEQVARLIESESAEGDSSTVAALQAALAALNDAEASEQTELGTPDDTQEATDEEAEADVAMLPMMMAAQAEPISGILTATVVTLAEMVDGLAKVAGMAKIGKRNSASDQKAVEQIHDLAVAAGAYPDAHKTAATSGSDDADSEGEAAAKAAAAEPISDTALADGIIGLIETRVPLAKRSDLDEMKATILEALEHQREEMAKIAAQPMTGGPIRYADSARFGDRPMSPAAASVEQALAKISDPRTRDEVGQALAAEAIAGIHSNT